MPINSNAVANVITRTKILTMRIGLTPFLGALNKPPAVAVPSEILSQLRTVDKASLRLYNSRQEKCSANFTER